MTPLLYITKSTGRSYTRWVFAMNMGWGEYKEGQSGRYYKEEEVVFFFF